MRETESKKRGLGGGIWNVSDEQLKRYKLSPSEIGLSAEERRALEDSEEPDEDAPEEAEPDEDEPAPADAKADDREARKRMGSKLMQWAKRRAELRRLEEGKAGKQPNPQQAKPPKPLALRSPPAQRAEAPRTQPQATSRPIDSRLPPKPKKRVIPLSHPDHPSNRRR